VTALAFFHEREGLTYKRLPAPLNGRRWKVKG
jgi:hypothetical protein